jgi:hypothetical protein
MFKAFNANRCLKMLREAGLAYRRDCARLARRSAAVRTEIRDELRDIFQRTRPAPFVGFEMPNFGFSR